jgi:iron complex outermembrane receptor protein
VSGRWLGGREDGRVGHQLGVSYSGARGDYLYFNDNGTILNLADDSQQRRQNNGYDQLEGVGRMRFARQDAEITLGSRALWKLQGIPGSATVQATAASLDTVSYLGDVSTRVINAFGVPELAAGATAFLLLEHQRYRDLAGEVGLAPQDRRYLTVAGGASGFARKRLGGAHRLAAGSELRVDHFSDRDYTGSMPLPRSYGDRLGFALTGADEIELGADAAWLLLPAVRLDVMHTIPASNASGGVGNGMPLPTHSEIYPSPRLAARYRVGSGLALKGSAGRYYRAPTVLELFGDRGFLVGNSELRAESGESVDLGLVVAPEGWFGPADRLYLELSGFGAAAHDTIAFSTSSGLVSRAQNLGDSFTYGAELSGSARLGRAVTFSGNYTFLDSRQGTGPWFVSGKSVPFRPQHEAYWRVDLATAVWERVVVLWTDVSFTSGNYLDAANLRRAPPRRFLGAGIKFELWSGFLLGVEARNLADQRVELEQLSSPPRPELTRVPRAVSDFAGYPLPGRALYVTLEWEPTL